MGGRWVKSHKIVRFPATDLDPTQYLAPRHRSHTPHPLSTQNHTSTTTTTTTTTSAADTTLDTSSTRHSENNSKESLEISGGGGDSVKHAQSGEGEGDAGGRESGKEGEMGEEKVAGSDPVGSSNSSSDDKSVTTGNATTTVPNGLPPLPTSSAPAADIPESPVSEIGEFLHSCAFPLKQTYTHKHFLYYLRDVS
jgi:hypothetical protein